MDKPLIKSSRKVTPEKGGSQQSKLSVRKQIEMEIQEINNKDKQKTLKRKREISEKRK